MKIRYLRRAAASVLIAIVERLARHALTRRFRKPRP